MGAFDSFEHIYFSGLGYLGGFFGCLSSSIDFEGGRKQQAPIPFALAGAFVGLFCLYIAGLGCSRSFILHCIALHCAALSFGPAIAASFSFMGGVT